MNEGAENTQSDQEHRVLCLGLAFEYLRAYGNLSAKGGEEMLLGSFVIDDEIRGFLQEGFIMIRELGVLFKDLNFDERKAILGRYWDMVVTAYAFVMTNNRMTPAEAVKKRLITFDNSLYIAECFRVVDWLWSICSKKIIPPVVA